MTIEEMYKWAVQYGYTKLPVYLYYHTDYKEVENIMYVKNDPDISSAIVIEV
jgi:hypothetical protein